MLPEGNSICQHTEDTLLEERGEERTGIKLDEIGDLAGVQVDADRVVDLDEGVWVADGAGVVGHQVGDTFGANDDLLHLAQLVLQTSEDKHTSTESVFQIGPASSVGSSVETARAVPPALSPWPPQL